MRKVDEQIIPNDFWDDMEGICKRDDMEGICKMKLKPKGIAALLCESGW